jgi:IS30 family transposase
MGRPKIEINQTEFEKLCALQCTLIEVAEWFNCSEDTIERWCKRNYLETFAEVYKKKSSSGKVSLRRKQFELAMEGSIPLLIWLGKTVLGQKETVVQVQQQTQTVSVDPKLTDAIQDIIKRGSKS